VGNRREASKDLGYTTTGRGDGSYLHSGKGAEEERLDVLGMLRRRREMPLSFLGKGRGNNNIVNLLRVYRTVDLRVVRIHLEF